MPKSIDEVLRPNSGPPVPTADEAMAAFRFVVALGQAIMEAGPDGVPSGHLYAMVMDKCSVQVYDRAIELLKRAGLPRRDARGRVALDAARGVLTLGSCPKQSRFTTYLRPIIDHRGTSRRAARTVLR
jgi:hypothetical protein